MDYSVTTESLSELNITHLKNILTSYIFCENTENSENTGSKMPFFSENSTENTQNTENGLRTTENGLRTGLASKWVTVLTLFSLCSHFFQSQLGTNFLFFWKHIRALKFFEVTF